MPSPTLPDDKGDKGCAPPASQDRVTDAPHEAARASSPSGSIPTGARPLRLCGYCEAWQSGPCGNGCHWQITDPTLESLESLSTPGSVSDASELVLFGTYVSCCRELFDNSHSVAFHRDLYGDLLGEAEGIKGIARSLRNALRDLLELVDAHGLEQCGDLPAHEFEAIVDGAVQDARAALARARGK